MCTIFSTNMKNLLNARFSPLFYLLVALLWMPVLSAQSTGLMPTPYQIWIDGKGGTTEEPAYLYLLADRSFYVSPTPLVDASKLIEYNIPDVYTLKFRRKGSIITGALLGASAGFLANGIADLLRQRHTESACGVCPLLAELDLKKGPNRRRYVGSTLLGGIAGGLIGSIRINISIGGSYQNYQYRRDELKKYLLRQ